MKIKCLLLMAAAVLISINARAEAEARPPGSQLVSYERDDEHHLFPANQLNLDVFGTFATRDRFGQSRDRWGGGVGLDYFFNRYLGIGADTYIEEWRWPYRVDGNVILRLPLHVGGLGLAPYAIGGGGREFKYVPQYTGHVGGGVELKLNRKTGVFADIRRVFPDKTTDYTLVRAGLRLGF